MADLPLDQAVARFQENEERIDKFVNAPNGEHEYETSQGESVPVLPKLLPQVIAQTERAETAAGAAEAARDTAVLDVLIAEDVADGLSRTVDAGTENRYFRIFSSETGISFIYYRHDPGGVATELKRYPSTMAVEQVKADTRVLQTGSAWYIGESDLLPLLVDAVGRVLLAVDQVSGGLYAAGLGRDATEKLLGDSGTARYIGPGPIYPVITDANNKVLLGFNALTGEMVGANASLGIQPAVSLPLAQPIDAKAVNHIIFYGQSLSVGAAAGAVLSVAQPYFNLTFNGGPRAWTGLAWDFSGFKPLVEDAVSPAPDGSNGRAETACSGAANYASTKLAESGVHPAEHVILASSAGHGGYRVNQLNKMAAWYDVLLNHVEGAQALEADHAVHAICWLQGENDIGVTSYATYRADLEQLQLDAEQDIKLLTSQTSPVYLITYQLSWGIKNSPDIALAHLSLAQSNEKFFLATPTYHLPHAPDNVHLTAVGYKWIGAYFGRAYAAIASGHQPRWLNPVSATQRGKKISVRFDVPVSPLVIDRTGLAETLDDGFQVLDGGEVVVIQSIETLTDSVLITLAAEPEGPVTVRYAMDYLGAGLTMTGGASGNLRDSCADAITISGAQKPLWNICPAFSMQAVSLGE